MQSVIKWAITVIALGVILASAWFFFDNKSQPVEEITQDIVLGAAPTKIRQEINITDAYMYAASGAYATSSAIVQVASSSYNGATAYFEVVASTTSGTNATVYLRNATSSATATSVTINGGNTYTRYRSSSFTMPDDAKEYNVVLGNEAVGKGIIASRIIILQSASSITKTETQIEIGSATTSARNTTSLPLQYPKYWSYNSSKWDATTTDSFKVEVTYKVTPVASSTIFRASATTTETYHKHTASTGVGLTVIEAWGGGGGGNGSVDAATTGGGGGGGGTYARSTTTVIAGSISTVAVGRGGGEGLARAATASSTFTTSGQTIIVAAQGGEGSTSGTGAATSSLAASIGEVIYAGGKGGDGETTADTGGGGGGSAGPSGYGISGKNATANGPGGAGGAGNQGSGGAGGAGGNGGDDTCNTELGQSGFNNVLGAGGGGGADGDVTSICGGGNGGRPGGGGGGSDEGTTGTGGPGQVKITEWIGTVGVALEESDGTGDGYTGWAFKTQIITRGNTSTSTARVRSASFTPVNGRNYRIVASTTNSTASYDIYNAKIVVVQSAGGTVSYSESNQNSELNVCTVADCISIGEGQSFTSVGGTLTSAKFYLRKIGSPTGNATAKLYAINNTIGGQDDIPSGAPLATSDTFDVATLTGSLALVTFTFTGAQQYAMVNGTSYVITFEYTGGGVGNFVNVGYDNSGSLVGNGSVLTASWSARGTDGELVFYVISSGPAPTLLQPQYLLAPFKLPAGTALQKFLTYFDPAEWASSDNSYVLKADAANGSASDILLQDSTGATTYATLNNPDNSATTTLSCIPSTATLWDTLANTNSDDVASVSVIVDVGGTQTNQCTVAGAATQAKTFINSNVIISAPVIIQ